MDADEPTLMFICETGYLENGETVWFERYKQRHTTANRDRILRRDAQHPTGEDGWKVVPRGVIGDTTFVHRYCWNDIRAYADAVRHD